MERRTFEKQRLYTVSEDVIEYVASRTSKPIVNSDNVVEIFRSLNYDSAAEEYLCMFCLSAKGEILAFHEISHGTVTSADCHPREVFKRALLNNAGSIIILHNHPSGDPEPSEDDVKAAVKLKECGKLMGVPLVDSIVVGKNRYVSLVSRGVIA